MMMMMVSALNFIERFCIAGSIEGLFFFLSFCLSRKFGNEFRKPMWIDDCESDDELSERKGFQIFTNPLEMHKYFEQQMQEMMKSIEMIDEDGWWNIMPF